MKIKNILFIILPALFVVLTSYSGCKKTKADIKTDCGCDAPNIASAFVENRTGTITYHVSTAPNDTFGINKFWVAESPSSGWSSISIICNENILPQEIIKLKETGGKLLTVQYAGYVKSLCDSQMDIPERSFYNITLTKITVQ